MSDIQKAIDKALAIGRVYDLSNEEIGYLIKAIAQDRFGKDANFKLVLKETHKSEYFGKHPWHIGTAYGGACLPKDIKAFVASVKKDSVYKKFIKAIDEVNEKVRKEMGR